MSPAHRLLVAAVAAAVAALLAGGCATTSDLAPLTGAPAAGSGVLEGRRIYLTCAGSCHAPEPVLKYSRAEWFGKHIPEMSQKAKLRSDQIAALESYIRAACPR